MPNYKLNENNSRNAPAAAPFTTEQGFTLIELSIVLVIIGLIVGGVLVGQDLIHAAEVRATISQIEKYNVAVNTFRGKYNALPGDMNAATATAFGFAARGASAGQGDGNGVIEGYNGTTNIGYAQGGETLFFWADLSVGNPAAPLNVNMIEGSFSTYLLPTTAAPAITAANAASYLPPAKLGRGNSVYVYSTNGTNYFGIAPITTTVTTGAAAALTASMTVVQSYQIDKKVDDGYPATGSVTATWNSGTLAENAAAPIVNGVATGSLASTSCYDSTLNVYALNQNGGAGANCALSFRFQ